MRTLMILATFSILSISAAATARACDGMRDHDQSAATHAAKNGGGKSDGKAKKDSPKPDQSDGTSTKS